MRGVSVCQSVSPCVSSAHWSCVFLAVRINLNLPTATYDYRVLRKKRPNFIMIWNSVSRDKVREFKLVQPFGPHNITIVRPFGLHLCLGGPEGLLILLCSQRPHKKADVVRPGRPDELFIYRIAYSILRIFVETLIWK